MCVFPGPKHSKFLVVDAFWFLRVLTSGVAFLHASLRAHPCSICLPPPSKYRSSNDTPCIETPRGPTRGWVPVELTMQKAPFGSWSSARGEVCKFGAPNRARANIRCMQIGKSAWQTRLQTSFAYELAGNDFYYPPRMDTMAIKFNICVYEIHTKCMNEREVRVYTYTGDIYRNRVFVCLFWCNE